MTIAALNTKATGIENKIPDITNLAAKAALDTKTTKIESKLLETLGFSTTAVFNRLAKVEESKRNQKALQVKVK